MFGWIPLILAAFALFPPRRAVLCGFVCGWLFLPIVEYPIPGFPDYTKLVAVCGGVLLGSLIFDFRRFLTLRPDWFDIPIVLFCFSPFFSSVSNELGLHDGLSVVFAQLLTWGVPYCLGRLYFSDLAALRDLACGIFAGALAYAPLTLLEFWIGPVLHRLVFGFAQPMIDSIPRFGGLRPIVFMESSLMVAAWMAAAAIVGIWMWRTGASALFAGLPMKWLVPFVVIASLLMRSVNGWFVLAVGTVLLFLSAALRTKLALAVILALILAFLGARASGFWSGQQAVTVVSTLINPIRAQSLRFRFQNEQIIGDNARRHPMLGWGRQLRPFYNLGTGRPAVPDSLWIAVFAQFGLIGLAGFAALLLLPVIRFLWRVAPGQWCQPGGLAAAAALAVVLTMYTVDLLFNGFANPIFMLASGGLAGLPRGKNQ